jgi:cell division septum initiation protein DivIVA
VQGTYIFIKHLLASHGGASIVQKITDIDRTDNGGETVSMASSATQGSVHAAMDYALKSQEINTQLLRLTAQAWIESFRLQSTLFQGMSEVTKPATGGAQDTEVAAEDAHQKLEKEKAEKQRAEEVATETRNAAKETQKSAATATFPIEGYDEMGAGEVSEYLDGLSVDELKWVRKHEKDNKNRRSLRKEIKQKIRAVS